jgi:hypothetical protein
MISGAVTVAAQVEQLFFFAGVRTIIERTNL